MKYADNLFNFSRKIFELQRGRIPDKLFLMIMVRIGSVLSLT